MRKILALILALLTVFALAACGGTDGGSNKKAPRFTGLDGENEGDGSIQKWAQNCSVSYRYSQLAEGEKTTPCGRTPRRFAA